MRSEIVFLVEKLIKLIEEELKEYKTLPDDTEIYKHKSFIDPVRYIISPAGKNEQEEVIETLKELGMTQEPGGKGPGTYLLGKLICIQVEAPEKRAIYRTYKRNECWQRI